MSAISGLGGVNYASLVQNAGAAGGATAKATATPELRAPPSGERGVGPASGLDEALQALHASQDTADKAVLDLASGKEHNHIHNTMVALEEADIALKFTVQLRNRALAAYEELMRIQV